MPLGQIPPWLNIGPTDYLHAIQAGTQAGLEVNRQRALAEEAAARRDLAQQEAQRAAWEFGETMRQRAALAAAENEQQREYQSGMLDWRREQMRMDAEKAAMGDQEAQARLKETIRHNLITEGLTKAENERGVMPTEWERDPNKEYISRGGAHIPIRKTEPSEFPVTEKFEATPEIAAVPAQPAEKRSLLGIDWLWPDKPAIPGISYQPAFGERTIKRALLPGELPRSAPGPSEGTAIEPEPQDTFEVPPPASERIPGRIYLTPKGQFKWTGSGWVKP